MTRFGIVRLSGAALIALSTAAMIAVGTAGAMSDHGKGKPQREVVAGDDRAEAHDGNATTCADIGLPDATFIDGDYLVDQGYATTDGYKVTIGQLPEDVTLLAIVIKGSDAYNVYVPGERGLDANPPYSDLRSPDNNGNNIPQISHWFACGTKGDTEESPTPTPTPTCSMPGGQSGGEQCTPPSECDEQPSGDNGGENGGDCTPPCDKNMPPGGGDEECTPPSECDEQSSGDNGGENGGDCTPPCDKNMPPGGGDEECTPPSECDEQSSGDNGGENGGENGGDQCNSPSPTPSTGEVSDASPTPSPTSGGEVGDATPPRNDSLAHTGFNTGLSLGIAGLLLVVGALMLLAPNRVAFAQNRVAIAVARLRRRG